MKKLNNITTVLVLFLIAIAIFISALVFIGKRFKNLPSEPIRLDYYEEENLLVLEGAGLTGYELQYYTNDNPVNYCFTQQSITVCFRKHY